MGRGLSHPRAGLARQALVDPSWDWGGVSRTFDFDARIGVKNAVNTIGKKAVGCGDAL